jgi:hypothetical protein
MANVSISIDPLIQKLVHEGAANLITQIQNDIKTETQISNRTYETCNSILNETRKEYIRIQIAFVEETKILIEKALLTPDSRFHKTWMHMFDIFTSACEQISAPILQVLNSVSIESVRLKHKYQALVAGAVTSSVIGTFLVGVLVAHFGTFCSFTLTTGGLALAIGGLAVSVGLAIALVIGALEVSQIRGFYDRCTSELKTLLVKYMPKLFSKNTITQQDLKDAIKDALNSFKIKEETWTDRDSLEMLHRQTVRILTELRST